MPIEGILCFMPSFAMAVGALLYVDEISNCPSPVIIKLAPAIFSSTFKVSKIISTPGLKVAEKNATMPAPIPPAAPPPSKFKTSFPISFFMTLDKCIRLLSRISICCLLAPFCGPYTYEAPSFPHKVLVTSHATSISTSVILELINSMFIVFIFIKSSTLLEISEPSSLRNFIPNALATPTPQSFVALPPMPNIILLTL